VQYKGDNFQAAVICKDKGRDLKASYVQDVNSNLAIAAEFTCLRGEKSANLLTLGMSHKCDDDASCRAKINTEGIFSVVYCQRLKSDVTMKLSGQIDTQKLDNQAPRVGLVLTADL